MIHEWALPIMDEVVRLAKERGWTAEQDGGSAGNVSMCIRQGDSHLARAYIRIRESVTGLRMVDAYAISLERLVVPEFIYSPTAEGVGAIFPWLHEVFDHAATVSAQSGAA
jgi:hypothetical protein